MVCLLDDLLLGKAESGDPEAQCDLALCYFNGVLVKRDIAIAFNWFLKSAFQGNPTAQYHVGLYYQNGQVVTKNFETGFSWMLKAAEQGQKDAQANIGICYLQGIGTNRDPVEGVKWLEKAAGNGSPSAMFNLSFCYRKGVGTDADNVRALKWLIKSAESGLREAKEELARAYEEGDYGVEVDSEQAKKWREAAREPDFNSPAAQQAFISAMGLDNPNFLEEKLTDIAIANMIKEVSKELENYRSGKVGIGRFLPARFRKPVETEEEEAKLKQLIEKVSTPGMTYEDKLQLMAELLIMKINLEKKER